MKTTQNRNAAEAGLAYAQAFRDRQAAQRPLEGMDTRAGRASDQAVCIAAVVMLLVLAGVGAAAVCAMLGGRAW